MEIAQFCAAAKLGDTTTVLRLVKEGIPPDERDIYLTTPLWHAASRGHQGVVQVLLATNAVAVNAASVSNRTPLFWSAAHGHTDIVELLLSYGASQDYVDVHGWSPLAIARHYGQAEVAAVLIKRNTEKSPVT
jgi:ankyrin repeat protein